MFRLCQSGTLMPRCHTLLRIEAKAGTAPESNAFVEHRAINKKSKAHPPLAARRCSLLKGSPMKRLLLATTLLALLPAVASAQDAREYRGGAKAGDSEITLSGTGTSNNDFDSGGFGVTGSYGYYFTPAFELGA